MKSFVALIIFGAILIANGLSGQSTSASLSQNSQSSMAMLENLHMQGDEVFNYASRYRGVKGSAFLYEKFSPALITLQNGNVLSTEIPVNIDLHANVPVLEIEPNKYSILPAEAIASITFTRDGETVFQVMDAGRLGVGDQGAPCFAKVHWEGPVSFLEYDHRRLKKTGFATNSYMQESNFDEFIANNSLHLCPEEGACVKVRLKKKPVLKALEELGIDGTKAVKTVGQIDTAEDLKEVLKLLEK